MEYVNGYGQSAVVQIRPHDILDWVSLDELTRFEHKTWLEDQVVAKAKLRDKQLRRSRFFPGPIQPIGPVNDNETDLSTDEQIDEAHVLSSAPGLKRPRGRPRKQPLHVNVSESIAKSSGYIGAVSPTFINKNACPRFMDSEVHPLPADTSRTGFVQRHSRRTQAINHIFLPQVKKRIPKITLNASVSSSSASHLPVPLVVISNRTASEKVASSRQLSPCTSESNASDVVGSDLEDARTDLSLPENSTLFKVQKTTPPPNDVDQSFSGRPKRPSLGQQPLSVDSSDDRSMGDALSSEDELAAFDSQFDATPMNHSHLKIARTPLTAVRAADDEFIHRHQTALSSPVSQAEDIRVPPGGRKASLDLGARSSSEDSLKENPITLWRRELTDNNNANTESHSEDSSSDSMAAKPIRVQRRPIDEPDLPDFNGININHISHKNSSKQTRDHRPIASANETGSDGDAQRVGDAIQDQSEDEFYEIPNLPSSQSFQRDDSSDTSDDLIGAVVQKSEAKATSKRAARINPELPQTRVTLNGYLKLDRAHQRATAAATVLTPRQQNLQVSITPSPPTSARVSHNKRDKFDHHVTSYDSTQIPRPQDKKDSTKRILKQAGALASMGAGETFPATTPLTQLRNPLVDPPFVLNAEDNPWGQPLPIHPVAPPVPAQSDNADGVSKSKPSTTRKRLRQSMTPLFPRAAKAPDLTPNHGNSSKRKQPILSTQQFKA